MEARMSRYTVCVLRELRASHFLIGGDWGRENEPHAHDYRLEASFAGDALDQHGYLLDISVVEQHLDRLVERYQGRMLNDLPELEGKNPSLERFARLLAEGLARALTPETLVSLTVKLWESATAYATYTVSFR
jgi:6-pyruvoyltetrahydropterin/6-carboxytetrahydropterin synthase